MTADPRAEPAGPDADPGSPDPEADLRPAAANPDAEPAAANPDAERKQIPTGTSGARPTGSMVRVVPSWTDPLATAAAAAVGGPLGRHAVVGRSRFWTPLRVILALTVLACACGWLLKSPCLQQFQAGDGNLSLDWRNNRQYVAMCYTDLVTIWHDRHLGESGVPYRDGWTDDAGTPAEQRRYLDYPVGTGYPLWLLARVTHGYLGLPGVPKALPEVVYFSVVALGLALCWLVVVRAVHRQRPLRPWDAALLAVGPVVAVQLFTAPDAWAVALTALALAALSRARPVHAGVWLGLAGAAAVYPLTLLLPIMLVAMRRGATALALRLTATCALTWTAVNLPVAVRHTRGWLEFLRLGVTRPVEADSLWSAVGAFTGWPGFDGPLGPHQAPVRLDLVVVFWTVMCAVGLVLLARWAAKPPRLASLCFLLVAAQLLVSKTPSPQFTLWLLPLAVLALPRWRLLLTWMTVEAVLWYVRLGYLLGAEHKGLLPSWYATAVLVRDGVLVGVVVLVVRSVLHPGQDPVRRTGSVVGVDDPDWPGATRAGCAAPAAGTSGRRA